MMHAIHTWAAAHADFVVPVLLTAVLVTICCIVFPQDGSGGDFDLGGGDCGGD